MHLLFHLVKRDLSARFVGSVFGLVWAVLQPLSMIGLYWFVFGLLLPGGRTGTGGEGYIFFLITGLVPWIGFAEGVSRGTTSVVDGGSIVRRMPFRSELLVVVPNITAMIFEAVALTGVVGLLLANGRLGGRVWILPVVLLAQLALQVGIGLFLSMTYVFFRDAGQVVSFGMSVLFYLSPILYEVRGQFAAVFRWNPLTPLLGLFRCGLTGAPLPDGGSIVFLATVTTLVLFLGVVLFRRAQSALVDLV